MCGIAGFFSRTGESPDRAVVERMVAAVSHRGPDGDGFYFSGPVALGHRRLAIIDLSPAGAQPMHCAASDCVIVFNGEIYNYLELRAELAASGYPFRTRTDTEVVLAAYHRWGPDCVKRFNGMWAFALLDASKRRVFCSRDRFGVKPFYYVDDPHFFAFGSELRQLLPLLRSRRASREALLDYLSFAVDERGTGTFFDGVSSLAPGHSLFYELPAGGYSIVRHYQLPQREQPVVLDPEDAAAQFRELLTDAIRLRLRSDVQVGTCLSGGLDSSSVAVIASDLSRGAGGRQFASITAVSESPDNDESAYAKLVVDQADLQWFRVRPDFSMFEKTLLDVVTAQEEPFASPSICMQFFVMQEARRRGIPVLLDGQGGDETLLGYERYAVTAIRELRRQQGWRAVWTAMQDLAAHNDKLSISSQAMFMAYFSLPELRWVAYWERMRGVGWLPSLASFRRRHGRVPSTIAELQTQQIEHDSIPHLLRYEDKNSMWHSIETRLPFLDYRVVEFALSLETGLKIRNGWTKSVLRDAMNGVLPQAVIRRTNKLGFEAPDQLWLSQMRPAMLRSAENSRLLRDLARRSSSSLAIESLPTAVLWRCHIVALWEKQFEISDLTESQAVLESPRWRVSMSRQSRRVCTRCVMDGSDPEITFDDAGVCSHCRDFESKTKLTWFPNDEGRQRLGEIIDRVKAAGAGRPYDSLLGLSGGVDSSYLALKLHEWGLRPLIVHVDAGWNSELAVANIERVIKHCGFDLHTYVVDWEEMRDLQVAYLQAAVANQDVPQDHLIFASLYRLSVAKGIKTVFSGGNTATEGIFPGSWMGSAIDRRNLLAIHRQFGSRPLKTYQTVSFFDYYARFPLIHGMRTIRPLNYLNYNKEAAIAELEQKIGWRAYDRKHGESLFTRWFQNYYLPTRFGFDKRRPHYSSLIVSQQLNREDALSLLEEPLYEPDELRADSEFLIRKLRISSDSLIEFMKTPVRHHTEFPNQSRFLRIAQKLKGGYERLTGNPLRNYS